MGVVLLLAEPAAAQGTLAARAQAKQHYDRGVQLFKDAQFEPATVEFRRAYELSPNFAVLYNLGVAYAALGKPVEAVDTLQRYLQEGGINVPADQGTSARDELARQKQRIATLTIRVSQDGATIEVDGVEVGKSPLLQAVRVGVGQRRITVRGKGFRAITRNESVTGEENRTIEITLDVEHSAPSAPTAVPPAQSIAVARSPETTNATHSESSGPAPWPWVVVGVGGAMMIGGGVLLALAQSDIGKVEDADKGVRWEEIQDAYDNAPVKSGVGIALLGVGAAGITTGLIWTLAQDEEEAPAQVSFTPRQVTFTGRF